MLQLCFRVKSCYAKLLIYSSIESSPLFVGFVALKRSDSIVAAADDGEEDAVGEDELDIV